MDQQLAHAVLKDVIKRSGSLLLGLTSDRSLSGRNKGQARGFDRIVNEFIISNIKKEFPSHHVISEEGPSEQLSRYGSTWVIDPIDGSDNLARGILAYSISISLFHDNEIVMGA